MKKKSYLFFIPLLTIILSGCNFDVDPAKHVDNFYDIRKIYISEQNVAVNVGEKRFVEVSTENLGSGGTVETLNYTSCDPTLATAAYGIFEDPVDGEEYEGMYISGKKEGTTSIIASFKNASASIDVSVVEADDVPYIHLFNNNLCLELGNDFILCSDILYRGETYDIYENEIKYNFTFVEGYSYNVVRISQDESNGDIIISPNKVGKTKVIVSTIFFGVESTTLLDISVTQPGVGIVINNEGFEHVINNTYCTKLYVKDYLDFHQKIKLDIELFDGDSKLPDDKRISLFSDNPNIALVDGYEISGVSRGTTIIRGTYEGVELIINVSVDKPIISCPLLNNTIEVDVNPFITLSKSPLISDDINITGLYYQSIDNENVIDKVDEDTIFFDVNKIHGFVEDYGENKKFIVETEEIFIDTGLSNVYSKIIKTPNDLATWGSIAEAYVTKRYDFNGYFVLGNNIECPENGMPVAFDRNTNFAISSISECIGTGVGFNGVFDGKGYTINNYKPTGFGSFITYLTSKGTLKNIGFNNAVLDTSLIQPGEKDPSAVLVANGESDNGVNISNVFVNYKSIITNLGKYENKYCSTFSGAGGRLSLSSVFIDASLTYFEGDFDILGKLSCDGVYSIGGIHINNEAAFGQDPVVKSRIFNSTGTFYCFATTSEMQTHLQTQSVISNWDKNYWTNLENGIPRWITA